VFKLPCRVGRPVDVDGLADATEMPEYAAVVGMVRYGFKSAEHDSPFSLGEWFRKLFGGRS
jgi:cell division ATPase FtsA